MRHNTPIDKFKPPYNPAISEYPISELTDNPMASMKLGHPNSNAPATGSNIAHPPIITYVKDINNKNILINQINLYSPLFYNRIDLYILKIT